MSTLNIGLCSTSTITQSGTDSVSFAAIGTLNITRPGQYPIIVTLSSVAGTSLLDTINITNADVTLNGVSGVSALVNYNIGSGGTVRLQSTVGISVGTTFNFTGAGSYLVLGNGVNLNLLGSINGFGPGSNIDTAAASTSYTYSNNAGTGTRRRHQEQGAVA